MRLWDPATGEALGRLLTGHTDRVLWGAWGQADGRPVLATGGREGTVQLWDPVTRGDLGSLLTGLTGGVLWGAWGLAGGRPVLATGVKELECGVLVESDKRLDMVGPEDCELVI